jgi:diguanylate cyclase
MAAQATPSNPSEIAREALRQLAIKRVAPTPDNYCELYHEIAGTPADDGSAERVLLGLTAELARRDRLPPAVAQRLHRAASQRDWSELRVLLAEAMRERIGAKAAPAWPGLIRNLLQQWDSRHAGLTPAKKRDGLERVLAGAGEDAALLGSRLGALVEAWAGTPPARVDPDVRDAPPAGGDAPMSSSLRALLADTLEAAASPYAATAPALLADGKALARKVRSVRDAGELAALGGALKNFWFRLELSNSDGMELHEGVLRLLRLLIDNVTELVADDKWLHGQIEVVKSVIANPLSIRMLEEAERALKEVIFKQRQLKLSLTEGKTQFKSLVSTFIGQLSKMADHTGSYQETLETCAKRIRETEDIASLNDIVEVVLRETRSMQTDTLRARDDLLLTQKRAGDAETRIHQLEIELERISDQVREDQLTGVLNRRGLDDAMQRETARAVRRRSPLSVALLDIDNFKRLNDTHGHQAGDAALRHLADVIHETLRPNDVVARYGGEEFLILLPDTRTEEGVEVMTRLQRELTRRFFLHGNERLLITFSAGVATLADGEVEKELIARADAAMYEAKRSGKNRVQAAALSGA